LALPGKHGVQSELSDWAIERPGSFGTWGCRSGYRGEMVTGNPGTLLLASDSATYQVLSYPVFSFDEKLRKIKVVLCFCALCAITAKGSQASSKLTLALTLALASYSSIFWCLQMD